jgi:hypothetical protein
MSGFFSARLPQKEDPVDRQASFADVVRGHQAPVEPLLAVGRRERKAPAEDGEPSRRSLEAPNALVAVGAFMADARRARPAPQQVGLAATDEGWQVVRRRQWRRVTRQISPLASCCPVPADLVGLCLNCLRPNHVAADCPNATRCFRCRREGHQARVCKRRRSADPPLCQPRLASVIVINPGKDNERRDKRRRSRSSIPPLCYRC